MTDHIHIFRPARGGKPFVVEAEDSIGESGALEAFVPASSLEALKEEIKELRGVLTKEVPGGSIYFLLGAVQAYYVADVGPEHCENFPGVKAASYHMKAIREALAKESGS